MRMRSFALLGANCLLPRVETGPDGDIHKWIRGLIAEDFVDRCTFETGA